MLILLKRFVSKMEEEGGGMSSSSCYRVTLAFAKNHSADPADPADAASINVLTSSTMMTRYLSLLNNGLCYNVCSDVHLSHPRISQSQDTSVQPRRELALLCDHVGVLTYQPINTLHTLDTTHDNYVRYMFSVFPKTEFIPRMTGSRIRSDQLA